MPGEEISVLVVDDVPYFHAAAAVVIAAAPGFVLVSAVRSGEEALAILARTHVDLVLMDVRMPGLDGVEAANRIHLDYPRVNVLLLSAHPLDRVGRNRLPASVGFCPKEEFGLEALEASVSA